MKYLQNLHTHTTYCDGRDTPREMIEAAIAQGFSSIGFSEHGPSQSLMTPSEEKIGLYKKEIRELAREYEGAIDVFCGLEYEAESDTCLCGYDYIIASSHYVHKNGGRYVADGSVEEMQRGIDEGWGGNGLAFALDYFAEISLLPTRGKFDIVGHFDLVSKNCERANFFDVNDPAYIAAGLAAIDALTGKIPLFEVNTGAISRGYRTTPYPAPVFLDAFRARGFGAVITSDCHDARNLTCGFEDAERMLAAHGFTERYILTKEGFVAIPLRGV